MAATVSSPAQPSPRLAMVTPNCTVDSSASMRLTRRSAPAAGASPPAASSRKRVGRTRTSANSATTRKPLAPVKLTEYPGNSDPGPMPIPANALIAGYPKPGNGDRHVLVLDQGSCWLYELYYAGIKNGAWYAGSSAIWDMTINEQRPYTWTSADAAGLPIFVGLVRYDEVAAGAINHAVRFTVPLTQQAFTPPASHWAPTTTDANAPPMGMRMRLKARFDISGFSSANQVILTALKKYGMILADNGSAIFITGMPDSHWKNHDLDMLKSITASSFDVVLMNPVYTPSNVPTGPSPAVASFTADPMTVSAGQPVTLSWNVTGAIYNIVSPQVGPVRGTSVVVTPAEIGRASCR